MKMVYYCPCYLHLYMACFLTNSLQNSRHAASDNPFFSKFSGGEYRQTHPPPLWARAGGAWHFVPEAVIHTPPPQQKSWLRACTHAVIKQNFGTFRTSSWTSVLYIPRNRFLLPMVSFKPFCFSNPFRFFSGNLQKTIARRKRQLC